MKRVVFEKRMLFCEKAFFIVSMIHYSAGVLPVVIMGGASEGENVSMDSFNWAANQALYLLTYTLPVFLLACHWKNVIRQIQIRDILLPILVILAPLSVQWSIYPDITSKVAISLIGTTLLALYFASRFTIREQLFLLAWSCIISIGLSFLFIGLLPQYGIEHGVHSGAFRGIFTHKNTFGRFLVLCVVVFTTILLVERPKNSAVFKYGLLGCGVLLLFARSSSSILNSFSLTILAILLYRVLQFRIKLLIPSIILMILSIWGFSFIAYGVAETFANFFGKDLTLTGRTDIWAGVITMIKQRPEGYGIGTFWLQPKTFMMRQFGWLPPTAHNGFLELALDLGVPGLLIYCLISLRILVRAFFLSRKWNITIDSFWPFIFFFFTISSNLTESSLFGANSVFPLLFMTLYFSLFFFPRRPAATLQ